MNRIALLLSTALLAGCNANSPSDQPSKLSSTPDAAKTAAPAPEYLEVPVGGNLYVVASKESAAKAAAGKLEKPVRAIGFGAPGQKVYFEEKHQAFLEAEYQRRHPVR